MKIKFLLLITLIIPNLVGVVHAHTVDSIGEYRIEIGWMNEPVVSGETNGIELYINPLEMGIPVEKQEFKNGVVGLEKSLKVQLVFKDEKITLGLDADHDIPGKYYAYVNPTVAGFYQANILGNIGETSVSLSMHPPKVDERSYIEFPESSDVTLNQIITAHTTMVGSINDLKDSVNELEQSSQLTIGYVGIIMSGVAITIAIVSISRTKRS